MLQTDESHSKLVMLGATYALGTDHQPILQHLPQLKLSGVFSDCTVYLNDLGTGIQVHRLLLAATGNGFLRRILSDSTDDDASHIIMAGPGQRPQNGLLRDR